MNQQPQTIGPYRTLRMLGRGGGGVVYHAEHLGTGLEVALKTVALPRQELLEGIRREIHTLARIRHPGVVRILEEGLEHGVPWYAMELVEGLTLRQHCRALASAEIETQQERSTPTTLSMAGKEVGTEPQPGTQSRPSGDAVPEAPATEPNTGIVSVTGLLASREMAAAPAGPRRVAVQRVERPALPEPALRAILRAMRRLCATLAYVHGEGLVHRDLKPGNVLVRPDGAPVLVDFGLVTRFAGPLSREALEVGSGPIGTVPYMAPEQVLGELLDARADLYALGCMLYELISGRPPFVGRTPGEVLDQHLEAQPVSLLELHPELPETLDALVLRLLRKRPEERLGHADDVAAALERLGAEDGFAHEAPMPRAYLYRPRFTGRTEVLELLDGLVRQLNVQGGALVLLGGESGVGKTRLAVEAAKEAQSRGLCVLLGECQPVSALSGAGAGGAPLQPLRKLLQHVADRCREQGPTETESLLGQRGPVLALYEPALGALPGQAAREAPADLPAEAARLRLFSYLAETLSALGERQRLVLVLDDLQWADELTLSFLEHLLRTGRLRQMRVLVVGTYRAEELGDVLRRVLDCPGVHRVGLERLDEAGVGTIVGDMLALDPPPQLFARFLARQSEGNPFFVAEFLRTAVAERLLARDELGQWQVAEPGPERAEAEAVYAALPLPGSIRELVGRRLEGLTPAARRVAEAAAVLGREVDAALLAEVGALEAAQRREAVQELLVRQVLEEPGAERLRFTHDKIREAAYERLDPEARCKLHRSAARAIETQFAAQRDEHLAELGRHWEQAGEEERAKSCYLGAARRAAKRYAHAEAERLYQAYLGLVHEPTPESIAARNELGGDVLAAQSHYSRAVEEHRRALEEARVLGDGAGEARALQLLGMTADMLGRSEEACTFLKQALAISRELGERRLEARALNDLGNFHSDRGHIDEAWGLFEEAMGIWCELGDRSGEGLTLINLGNLHFNQGRLSDARSLYEQALSIHRESDNRWHEVSALLNLACVPWVQGRVEEIRLVCKQALLLARQIGDRRAEGHALHLLAHPEAECGRIEEAHRLFETTLAIFRECGDRKFEGITLSYRATLERRVGELDQAERTLDAAELILTDLGDLLDLARSCCERGHLALVRDRMGRPFLEKAQQMAAALGVGPESEIGRAVIHLRRAVEAFERGGRHRLYRGELLEDLPDGLRSWLEQSGHLRAASRQR
jgi:tetratricopeptide (TPR) repeat protein